MADQILDVPKEFIKDGGQFINRCTKREFFFPLLLLCPPLPSLLGAHDGWVYSQITPSLTSKTADQKEFIKVCQAVGVGFLIMGATGYLVKLSTCPSFLPAYSSPSIHADSDTAERERERERTNAYPTRAVHIPVNNILVGGA